MWNTKLFKTLKAQSTWVESHEANFQIVELFVENGYGVIYKKLRVIG